MIVQRYIRRRIKHSWAHRFCVSKNTWDCQELSKFWFSVYGRQARAVHAYIHIQEPSDDSIRQPPWRCKCCAASIWKRDRPSREGCDVRVAACKLILLSTCHLGPAERTLNTKSAQTHPFVLDRQAPVSKGIQSRRRLSEISELKVHPNAILASSQTWTSIQWIWLNIHWKHERKILDTLCIVPTT